MLAIDFSKPIPLFPLATCALLPHATVPLHVFEPRYRTMTSDAIDGNRLMALATFEGESWKTDYHGRPPLRDHVCVGYIFQHERLKDGRYNLLVQGICRAKICEEIENEPYRLARLEPTEDDPLMEIDLDEQRQHLEELFDDPSLKQLAAVSTIRKWMTRDLPTSVLIDLATLAISNDADERYAMLAEPRVDRRAVWLEKHLRYTRRTLQIADQIGPAQSEDGLSLN